MKIQWWKFWTWKKKAIFWEKAWENEKNELNESCTRWSDFCAGLVRTIERQDQEIARLNHLLTPKPATTVKRCKTA